MVAEARFAHEEEREAFLTEYLQDDGRTAGEVREQEGVRRYRVVLAAYPEAEGGPE